MNWLKKMSMEEFSGLVISLFEGTGYGDIQLQSLF